MSEPTTRTEEYLDAIAKAAARIADALDRMEPRHFDATATARVVDPTADLTAPTTYNPGGQLPHGWTRDWLWNGHAAPMSAAEAEQAPQDAVSPSGWSAEGSGDVLDESDHRVRHMVAGHRQRIPCQHLYRHGPHHWHTWEPAETAAACAYPDHDLTLSYYATHFGLLGFCDCPESDA